MTLCGLPRARMPLVDAVQALLGAVGDLQDVVGLAGLAVGQRRADPRRAAVVPGRLDQQPAGERRAGLGDRALPARTRRTGCSDGVSPSHAASAGARSKRCQSPPSSRCIDSAVSVSIPRNAAQPRDGRPPPLVGRQLARAAQRDRGLARVSPSTAAIRSANASSLAGSSNCCADSQRRCAAVQVVGLRIDAAVAQQQLATRGGARSSDRARHASCARVSSRAASTSGGGTTTARQRPGQQQPRQQLGVLAIGLDPIRRTPRRLARRDHLHRRSPPRSPPDRARTRRPGLIARPHRARQPPQPRDRPPRPRRRTATRVSSPVIDVDRRAHASSARGHQDPPTSSFRSRPDLLTDLGSAGAHSPARQTPARSVRPTTPTVNPSDGSTSHRV